MNRILIIEDEEMIRKQLSKLLERNNYIVTGVSTIEEATESDPDSYDLILADIRLPGAPGTDILTSAQHAPVVIMTSHASVRSAVDSMKLGAVDYISKPFDHAELLLVIERSLHQNRLSVQNAAMRRDLRRALPDADFETRNSAVRSLKKSFENLPANAACIYLHGERGSGRELLARLIHENSDRAGGPLVIADIPLYEPEDLESLLFGNRNASDEVEDVSSVNGNAFGLLREAHAGTLVLRNTTALTHAAQEMLCDWFEDGTSLPARTEHRSNDIRLIILNVENLAQAVHDKDLSPRFAQLFDDYQFWVPPLRERPEDIEALAQHFLQQFSGRYRKRSIILSADALQALQSYHWPGNVTELRSIIERAVLSVNASDIEPLHLGFSMNNTGDQTGVVLDLSLDNYFRYFVLQHQAYLSETELAQKLGISRKALWERRQKMDLPRN